MNQVSSLLLEQIALCIYKGTVATSKPTKLRAIPVFVASHVCRMAAFDLSLFSNLQVFAMPPDEAMQF
ncbi:hypothetical protein D918_01259 [Trichuris suis]|nr:hypothetical protein D918_01259 [Trichuris suis]